jgi:rubredoxin
MGISNVSPKFYDLEMKRKCPNCNLNEGIRTILYGMPMEEPDPAVYTIGGCCISDDMPKYECVECGWKGSRSELKPVKPKS